MHSTVRLVLVPLVASLRCYDYMDTNVIQNMLHSWVDCPSEAQFCYKSYTERIYKRHSLRVDHVEHPISVRRDKACCCKKELCNIANSL